jgi:NodT family efflux transporter outer membrane factor (OMF) lipoprotein
MRHLALPLALLAAGCTTVGPDYAPPALQVSGAWLEPADARPIDPAWWNAFSDRELVRLIERALADSPDLAEATARLHEARANRDAVLGRGAPQGELAASATENRLSENGQLPIGNIPGFDPEFSLFDLGFDASWEFDLWGRRVREAEGAAARVEAAEADLQQTLVVLTGEIARSYMDLRGAQAEARAAQRQVIARGELAALAELRYAAGETSRIDFDRAGAEANTALEAQARAEAQAAAAAYRLASLLGEPPEAVVPALLQASAVPRAPGTILTGLHSELLRRRPDVRRAERELAAAIADIGVATADLFPRFSLLGGIGVQSRAAGDLPEADSVRFSLGPSFAWPIFSGGQLRARIRAADARAEAAAARYERAATDALADSEGAINRYLAAQRAERAAATALAAQRSALALAERRFAAGEDDRLALERARLEAIEAERRADIAAADAARAAVAAYKALGGAWQAVPAPE